MSKKTTSKKREIHFVGICGIGMSALAVLYREAGWQVTGSAEDFYEPAPSLLHRNKIFFHEKYDAKNVPPDVDLVVIGKNTPLSAEENPETQYAMQSSLKIASLPEAIAMLSEGKEITITAGNFGKSTIAGLLSWCLSRAKRDPSYFIGGIPLDLKNSSHLGKGREFVLEGDEYPSSNTDKRSKFLHFNPSAVLLISASHDHANVFPTEESYKKPYKKLVAKIPKNGLLVYCLDGKNTKEIAREAKCRTVSYGLENEKADWYAKNIKYGLRSSFDLMHKGKKIGSFKTKLLGKHSIENIIGAGALLLETGKITSKVFARAVTSFHGIKGRIEPKTKKSKIPVYAGFGSSYEKARSVFETLRLHFPDRKIIAVFEPYAFSWRNRKFLKWYKHVFDGVNEAIILPATGHGRKAKDQIDTKEVWREAKKHANIYTARGEKDALKIIREITRSGDVIALVSSGPMFGLIESVPKLVEKMFPKNNTTRHGN